MDREVEVSGNEEAIAETHLDAVRTDSPACSADSSTSSYFPPQCPDSNEEWDRFLNSPVVLKQTKQLLIIARSILKEDDAQDAMIEAIEKAFTNAHKIENWSEGAFFSWRRTVLTRLCVERKKKAPRLESLDLEDGRALEPVDPNPTPEALALAEAGTRDLLTHVDALPVQEKNFLLAWLEGEEFDTIAKANNLTVGTVRAYVSRARRYLRERLNPTNNFKGSE